MMRDLRSPGQGPAVRTAAISGKVRCVTFLPSKTEVYGSQMDALAAAALNPVMDLDRNNPNLADPVSRMRENLSLGPFDIHFEEVDVVDSKIGHQFVECDATGRPSVLSACGFTGFPCPKCRARSVVEDIQFSLFLPQGGVDWSDIWIMCDIFPQHFIVG